MSRGAESYKRGQDKVSQGEEGQDMEYEQVLRDFDVRFRLRNEKWKQWMDLKTTSASNLKNDGS